MARPLQSRRVMGATWGGPRAKGPHDEIGDTQDQVGALFDVAGGTGLPGMDWLGRGYKAGRFGDEGMKSLGWLRDDQGRAQSVSDRGSDWMIDAHDWVADKTGSDLLGHLAGGLTGIGAAPVEGAMAAAGAVGHAGQLVGQAGSWVGSKLGLGGGGDVDLMPVIAEMQRKLAGSTHGSRPPHPDGSWADMWKD